MSESGNDDIPKILQELRELSKASNNNQTDGDVLGDLCRKAQSYYILNNNIKKNIELEMIIRKTRDNRDNRDNINVFSAGDIRTITEYLLNAGFEKVGEPSTFLRISLDGERDESNFGELKDVRISVKDPQGIAKFCNQNQKNIRDTYSSENVHFEKKVTYYYKNPSQSYKNVRMKVSEETNITESVQTALVNGNSNQNNVARYIQGPEFPKKNKTFRYINRVSFVHKGGPGKKSKFSYARVDISTVYESSNTKWYGVSTKYPPKYEVEIESIFGNKEDDDVATPEDINKSMLYALKTVLSGVQDSCYPITTATMESVNNAYEKCSKELGMTNSTPWYKGPQPVTFQRDNIETVCKDGEYTVTNKSDGLRKLLFIHDSKVYLLDSRRRIQYTGITLPSSTDDDDVINPNGTVLDGELVKLNGPGSYFQYQVFDIYKKGSISTLGDKFYDRLQKIKAVLNYLNTNVSNKSNIQIISKEFEPVVAEDEGEENESGIEKVRIRIRDEAQFNNDGMILTPTGPVPGSNGNKAEVYKWKEVADTTIDFRVKFLKRVYSNEISGSLMQKNFNIRCALHVVTDEDPIKDACMIIYQGKELDTTSTFRAKTKTDVREVMFSYSVGDDDTSMDDVGFAEFQSKNNESNTMVAEEDIGNGKESKKSYFTDGDIVECSYRENKWVAIRVRKDKLYPNFLKTAENNFKFIKDPVTFEENLCEGDKVKDSVDNKNVYYTNQSRSSDSKARRDYHNYMKNTLITSAVSELRSETNRSTKGNYKEIKLIDYGVGKGGDLQKWIENDISFVYGIDYSESNLEDSNDGACARYLKRKKDNKNKNKLPLVCMFAVGDCSKSIENGEAFKSLCDDNKTKYTTKNICISELVNNSIFGSNGLKESVIPDILKGIKRIYGKCQREDDRFDRGSCQFAMHYYFKDESTVDNFIDNLKYTIKVGGYFIGTCFDGKKVWDLLLKENSIGDVDESNNIYEGNNISYVGDNTTLSMNLNSEGYTIRKAKELFEKEIGGIPLEVTDTGFSKQIEFLVNFELFDKKMKDNGFTRVVNDNDNFKEGYAGYTRNKRKGAMMNDKEKKISFLNTKFMYKRERNVDAPFQMIQNSSSSG